MNLLGVEEVKSLLDVKDSKAYSIIRQLNKELERKGYLIVRGKVPKTYLLERFYSN
ncbi:MAG: transcriptional regulator [Lawsonibacter sp.]|nr:transcriptional regulator [Lawsonibacter sp.]